MLRSSAPSQRGRPSTETEKKDANSTYRVPGGGSGGFVPLGFNRMVGQGPVHSPVSPNSFVLFTPPNPNPDGLVHVVVDPKLTSKLRPHQKEGVKFLWESVVGMRVEGKNGAIMADEMGLGKSLQVIAVLWTLLKQSVKGGPEISNAVIIAPSSLIGNWEAEIKKWLGPTAVRTLTLTSGPAQAIYRSLSNFVTAPLVSGRSQTPVLIISYEAFRNHAEVLGTGEIGLVICDEGHKLKNQENQTYQALSKIKTKRRIVLTGTPIQNDLTEYYSLVNFVSEGILGNSKEFRKKFELPILKAKDTSASDAEKRKGALAMQELTTIVNQCMIRRTSEINNEFLPQKYEFVVCVKMVPGQTSAYNAMMQDTVVNKRDSLAAINKIRKVLNHPDLIQENAPAVVNPELSGKLSFLDQFITETRRRSQDKFLIVSNFTKTLDLIGKYFRSKKYGIVRIDGKMVSAARTKVVTAFNDPRNQQDIIMLLSSKAGGCGLNIIGANRLIMYDPDWNPANDSQAMARIWREGQKKTCYIYRLVATGTLEEIIYERQASKRSLSSSLVDQDQQEANRVFNSAELKRIFEEEKTTVSTIHDHLNCVRCDGKSQRVTPPPDSSISSNIGDWHHAFDGHDLPDDCLKASFNPRLSFVFYNVSHVI